MKEVSYNLLLYLFLQNYFINFYLLSINTQKHFHFLKCIVKIFLKILLLIIFLIELINNNILINIIAQP